LVLFCLQSLESIEEEDEEEYSEEEEEDEEEQQLDDFDSRMSQSHMSQSQMSQSRSNGDDESFNKKRNARATELGKKYAEMDSDW
jgi:hypothetical protein